jgi:uncharacterized protein YecE (DUF72 family)
MWRRIVPAEARKVLRIGTSGWQYRDWRATFYPRELTSAQWLEYYAAHFSTVEVNNTFYRLPNPETFGAWAGRVPAGFEFAIKASDYLTHYKRLRDPQEPVDRLLKHAAPMRSHLAVVLLQLPSSLHSAPDRLDATLDAFEGRVRVAVELRHDSWFSASVRKILERHGAALCLADRQSRMITPEWRTAEWAYVRFHGGRAQPASCYGRAALKSWAERLRTLFGDSADGYVYFNNDANACAIRDAVAFRRRAQAAGIAVAPVESTLCG